MARSARAIARARPGDVNIHVDCHVSSSARVFQQRDAPACILEGSHHPDELDGIAAASSSHVQQLQIDGQRKRRADAAGDEQDWVGAGDVGSSGERSCSRVIQQARPIPGQLSVAAFDEDVELELFQRHLCEEPRLWAAEIPYDQCDLLFLLLAAR